VIQVETRYLERVDRKNISAHGLDLRSGSGVPAAAVVSTAALTEVHLSPD
jgi:hypothetical protein